MTGPIDGTSIITAAVVLAYASTITPDASAGGHFRLTLAGNPVIEALVNPADAQKVTFELIQPSSGGPYTVTWGAGYSFGSSAAPALTATAGKRDLIAWLYSASASEWLYAGFQPGF